MTDLFFPIPPEGIAVIVAVAVLMAGGFALLGTAVYRSNP